MVHKLKFQLPNGKIVTLKELTDEELEKFINKTQERIQKNYHDSTLAYEVGLELRARVIEADTKKEHHIYAELIKEDERRKKFKEWFIS